MKNRFSGAQRIASLFVLLALALHPSTRAFAQSSNAQTLPQLEVAPSVAGADGVFTLSLPVAPQGKSTRIAIYEHLRPNKLAEIKKNFTLQNGRWSTQLQLEADPGSYDLRVVSDDKTRAPLSSDAGVLVPGIVREPGWWLLNGSPFVETPKLNDAPVLTNAPLFIPGLKRDGKKFDRKVLHSGGAPLKWKALTLPDTNRLVAPGFNFEAWRVQVQVAIGDAQARGERNLLGVVIRAPKLVRHNDTRVIAAGQRVRQIVNELAPDAALILEIPEKGDYLYANGVSAWANFCDAVVVQRHPWFTFAGGTGDAWPIKVVRRVAEEQPNYDLPIFLATTTEEQEEDEKSAPIELNPTTQLFRFWMSGASGALTFTSIPVEDWREVVTRNASLFIGSATLEDAGIWPPSEVPAPQDIEEFYTALLDAGRIPGAARLQQRQGKKIPESFLCILGDSISEETIEKLRVAANGGARIYLEGAPKIKGDASRWNALVGAASTPATKKLSSITLDDPWLFGTARGSKIPIEQNTQVGALNAPTKSTSKKDEPEKGKDVLTAPRVVAKLDDGSPALIENPIGDGEVLWSPHRVLSFDRSIESASAQRDFYSAIAAHLGTGLLKIHGVGNAGTPAVRAAIRRSKNGTWLVGLFNASDKAAPIVVGANHFAGVALDLQWEKELPLDVRGNRSSVETTVPASGWQIIALAESREKLDQERFAPRSKAKLK